MGGFFLWPILRLIVLGVIAWGLWDALKWPSWILFVSIIGMFIGLDAISFIVLIIAFIAGFFKNAWGWSLALFPGYLIFIMVGNYILYKVIFGTDLDAADEDKMKENQITQ